jgi:dihydrofolate reductase
MLKMIAACSLNGVIGQADNKLPWGNEYKEDLLFFRKMTKDSTVIMARRTFDSVGKPLPKRRNIVVSGTVTKIDGAEVYSSFEEAFTQAHCDGWIIGGASAYQAGLLLAEEIYVTTIPATILGKGLVYFPYINHHQFSIKETFVISEKDKLVCTVFKRSVI